MPLIRILPPEVVNRIAAGEVIERPASLVKELVENSIDAQATEVMIDLEDGGKKKVAVRDNGCGMMPEDLPLAFLSHATSKLREAEAAQCLFGISTLGFRGEALASIAAVAQVEVVSRTPQAEHAYRLRPGGGAPEPAAGPPGTALEVLDLFYNVPVRRKFLRAAATELSHAVEQVTRLALAHPGIRFRLMHHGRRVLDLPPCSTLRERLQQVAGPQVVARLIEVQAGDASEGVLLGGFAGSPELRRSDVRGQHFFVNGRWIRDRLLAHSLRSAYQGLLIPGQQPVAYLFLDFPPGGVDVNVHPTKAEVRFREPGRIYPLVQQAVRRALEQAERAGSRTVVSCGAGGDGLGRDDGSNGELEGGRVEQAALDFFAGPAAREGMALRPFAGGGAWNGAASGEMSTAAAPAERMSLDAPPVPSRSRPFQVLDSYIIIEAGDGIALIDQHALHEKILFEQIHRSLLEGEVLRQKLLVPQVIELPLELLPLVGPAAEALGRCGFEIGAFGDRELAVHAVPKLFEQESGEELREVVLEVCRWLEDEPESESDDEPEALGRRRRRLASLLACKRAVKAGTRLSPEEIEGLLERRELAEAPGHCPHGRPTTVHLSRRELERKFDRK